jgi:hypothetical protein
VRLRFYNCDLMQVYIFSECGGPVKNHCRDVSGAHIGIDVKKKPLIIIDETSIATCNAMLCPARQNPYIKQSEIEIKKI